MKVYILEDEANILKYILSLIVDIPYLQVVGYAGEISKAEIEIEQQQPDLILADIHLKDGNSFSLFHKMEVNAQIIFITAYSNYAIDALNLGAFSYLLKPIDEAEFKQQIDRCYNNFDDHKIDKKQLEIASDYYQNEQAPTRIALKNFDYTQIVQVRDIMYCKSDKGYTTFYLNSGQKIVVSKVLKEYEALLPGNTFIRCHQSYLVNVNYISKYYKNGLLELFTKQTIPVSDRKKEVVLEFISSIS
ncbi:LytR/AlgR family response regulator transcription factor [Myroides phaeus]|uniref:LytR/AlgR family response regulator transcription factor n=1 Tax=Myroides phaeus TaxID=702745 RepID=UPI0013038C69|nr:LytTR family DNA-binding domain-containing protein [Myroides phaeus]